MITIHTGKETNTLQEIRRRRVKRELERNAADGLQINIFPSASVRNFNVHPFFKALHCVDYI